MEVGTGFEPVYTALQAVASPLGHPTVSAERCTASGRRDSNSRHPPWQGGALPTELRPQKHHFPVRCASAPAFRVAAMKTVPEPFPKCQIVEVPPGRLHQVRRLECSVGAEFGPRIELQACDSVAVSFRLGAPRERCRRLVVLWRCPWRPRIHSRESAAPPRLARLCTGESLGYSFERTKGNAQVRLKVRLLPLGDWRSGSALRSHRRGHWFEPSIAHQYQSPVGRFETTHGAFPMPVSSCRDWVHSLWTTDFTLPLPQPGGERQCLGTNEMAT